MYLTLKYDSCGYGTVCISYRDPYNLVTWLTVFHQSLTYGVLMAPFIQRESPSSLKVKPLDSSRTPFLSCAVARPLGDAYSVI